MGGFPNLARAVIYHCRLDFREKRGSPDFERRQRPVNVGWNGFSVRELQQAGGPFRFRALVTAKRLQKRAVPCRRSGLENDPDHPCAIKVVTRDFLGLRGYGSPHVQRGFSGVSAGRERCVAGQVEGSERDISAIINEQWIFSTVLLRRSKYGHQAQPGFRMVWSGADCETESAWSAKGFQGDGFSRRVQTSEEAGGLRWVVVTLLRSGNPDRARWFLRGRQHDGGSGEGGYLNVSEKRSVECPAGYLEN